jgi:hypothetical protein
MLELGQRQFDATTRSPPRYIVLMNLSCQGRVFASSQLPRVIFTELAQLRDLAPGSLLAEPY